MALPLKRSSRLHPWRAYSAMAVSVLLALGAAACRDMITHPTSPGLLPSAPTAVTSYGSGWTASGAQGTSSVVQTDAGGVTLDYQWDQPSFEPLTTWTFAATATQTTNLQFDWVIDGFHGWYMDQATLKVWARDANGIRTEVTLLQTPACEGDGGCAAGEIDGPFHREGAGSIQLTAGAAWGFEVSGSNYDGGGALVGRVQIAPKVSAPAMAWGTPTVDGNWGATEWANAATRAVLVKIPNYTSPRNGTLYVMNDGVNLYVALRFPFSSLEASQTTGNSLGFMFDNDNDGAHEPGDESFVHNASAGFFDNFFRVCGTAGLCIPQDHSDGGTTDGSGAFANSADHTFYEISKPLNSADDAHDFSLAVGSLINFNLHVRLINSNGSYANTYFPLGTAFHQIQIAADPAPPPPTTGTLAGTVKDPSGAPIPNAQVSVVGTNLSTLTNAQGQYVFTSVPAGTQSVQASAPGFQTQQSPPIQLAGGQTASYNFVLQPALHTLSVTVAGPSAAMGAFRATLRPTMSSSSSGVAGLTVTATNVANGDEFYIQCTDGNGTATFNLPAAKYVVHARNLPICNTSQMQEWPYVQDAGSEVVNTSNTQSANRAPVVLLNGQSEVLNPVNYKTAVQQGSVTLTAGGSTPVTLQYKTGATLQCSLLNSDGQTFTLTHAEHVYNVQPFGDETGLPPISASNNPKGLPRGIATVLNTMPAGSSSGSCSVSGVPAGDYVLETNKVLVTNADGTTELATYRETVTVTEGEASSGSTVEVVGEPEPVRAKTGYLLEPFGDSPTETDVGMTTFGWGVTPQNQVSNTFSVASDVRGLGQYTLELLYMDGSQERKIEVTALCEAKRCKVIPNAPRSVLDRVEVSGTMTKTKRHAEGTVVWSVSLPEVAANQIVRFRVITGQKPKQDAAPASGYQSAKKPTHPDDGNSWMVMGT